MKSHLRVYHASVCCFESKEHLPKVSVLRQGVHHFECLPQRWLPAIFLVPTCFLRVFQPTADYCKLRFNTRSSLVLQTHSQTLKCLGCGKKSFQQNMLKIVGSVKVSALISTAHPQWLNQLVYRRVLFCPSKCPAEERNHWYRSPPVVTGKWPLSKSTTNCLPMWPSIMGSGQWCTRSIKCNVF